MKRHTPVFLALFLLASLSGMAQTKRATTPKAVTIPAGTPVEVRIIDNLSSETSVAGDVFTGTLEQAIIVDGKMLFPKGADVTGRVVSAKKSGRLTDPGVLELELTTIKYGSQTARVTSETFLVKGESHKKSNITKIGGGAAAGAIIGAIAGGGKGAAIGAGAGAAAGTGVAAATGKKPAEVESEAVLAFSTNAPVTPVTTAAAREPATSSAGSSPAAPKTARSYDESDSKIQFSNQEISAASRGFGARDRRVIRNCFHDNREGLPPGLAKRERLPPGLERQLRKNGKLPPGLQKRVQPLPLVCERELPPLPSAIERVVYSGRILLLGRGSDILDIFRLDAEE